MKISGEQLFTLLHHKINPNSKQETSLSPTSSNINSQIKHERELLNRLFKDFILGNTTNQAIQNVLKTNPLFNNMETFSSLLNGLNNQLQSHAGLEKFSNDIKQFLINIQNLTPSQLQKQLSNSGLFLESKLHTHSESKAMNISLDMKSILLQLQHHFSLLSQETGHQDITKQIEKLLMQIEYYQLLSLSSKEHHTYLPFLWKNLEKGDLSFKRLDNKQFYIQLDLTLQHYGKLIIQIMLNESDLINLTLFFNNALFKKRVSSNLTLLRQSLKHIGFIPNEIQILDLKPDNTPWETTTTVSQNHGTIVNVRI